MKYRVWKMEATNSSSNNNNNNTQDFCFSQETLEALSQSQWTQFQVTQRPQPVYPSLQRRPSQPSISAFSQLANLDYAGDGLRKVKVGQGQGQGQALARKLAELENKISGLDWQNALVNVAKDVVANIRKDIVKVKEDDQSDLERRIKDLVEDVKGHQEVQRTFLKNSLEMKMNEVVECLDSLKRGQSREFEKVAEICKNLTSAIEEIRDEVKRANSSVNEVRDEVKSINRGVQEVGDRVESFLNKVKKAKRSKSAKPPPFLMTSTPTSTYSTAVMDTSAESSTLLAPNNNNNVSTAVYNNNNNNNNNSSRIKRRLLTVDQISEDIFNVAEASDGEDSSLEKTHI